MLRLLSVLAIAAALSGCDRANVASRDPARDSLDAGSLDLDGVKGHGDFLWSGNLMGSVLKACDGKGVGERLTFVGLNTKEPRVVFEGTGSNQPFIKVHETDKTVTLLWVATGTGSVDAFVIDKTTGKFARASAGELAGVYATASVGLCR